MRVLGCKRSLRQSRLPIAVNESVARGQVAKGLGFDPIGNPEMGISGEIESAFFARLVQPAELRQGRGQEAPGAGAICRLVAQSLDRGLVLPGRILSLP